MEIDESTKQRMNVKFFGKLGKNLDVIIKVLNIVCLCVFKVD